MNDLKARSLSSMVGKKYLSWNSTVKLINNIKKCSGFMNSNKNKLNSKIN